MLCCIIPHIAMHGCFIFLAPSRLPPPPPPPPAAINTTSPTRHHQQHTINTTPSTHHHQQNVLLHVSIWYICFLVYCYMILPVFYMLCCIIFYYLIYVMLYYVIWYYMCYNLQNALYAMYVLLSCICYVCYGVLCVFFYFIIWYMLYMLYYLLYVISILTGKPLFGLSARVLYGVSFRTRGRKATAAPCTRRATWEWLVPFWSIRASRSSTWRGPRPAALGRVLFHWENPSGLGAYFHVGKYPQDMGYINDNHFLAVVARLSWWDVSVNPGFRLLI